jgi:hypothetical protein
LLLYSSSVTIKYCKFCLYPAIILGNLAQLYLYIFYFILTPINGNGGYIGVTLSVCQSVLKISSDLHQTWSQVVS